MPERERPLSQLTFFSESEQEVFAAYNVFKISRRIQTIPEKAVYALHELWRTGRESEIYNVSALLRMDGKNPWDYVSLNEMSKAVGEMLYAKEDKNVIMGFVKTTLFNTERGSRSLQDNVEIERERMDYLMKYANRIIEMGSLKYEAYELQLEREKFSNKYQAN